MLGVYQLVIITSVVFLCFFGVNALKDGVVKKSLFVLLTVIAFSLIMCFSLYYDTFSAAYSLVIGLNWMVISFSMNELYYKHQKHKLSERNFYLILLFVIILMVGLIQLTKHLIYL